MIKFFFYLKNIDPCLIALKNNDKKTGTTVIISINAKNEKKNLNLIFFLF